MTTRRRGLARWELELDLETAHAEAAAYREVVATLAPTHVVLASRDAGRAILDRLRMAEEVSHDSVVDGLLELRDALAEALSMVPLKEDSRPRWRVLKECLNRWGDVHLRLIGR